MSHMPVYNDTSAIMVGESLYILILLLKALYDDNSAYYYMGMRMNQSATDMSGFLCMHGSERIEAYIFAWNKFS